MAGGLENLLPVQILVLYSLVLPFILFLCAGVRRTETPSGVPVQVPLLWLAYNFADTVATYTLARLSIISTAGNHPLAALWAPFLLLHLAGPDNIAAYALQDSQLSFRSLQTFLSQVTGAAYIHYTNSKGKNSSGNNFLPLASHLMFAVGVVKYGERWLALQRGNLGSISDSLKKQPSAAMHWHDHPQDKVILKFARLDDESHVRRAHSLFHICKRAIVGSSVTRKEEPRSTKYIGKMLDEHVNRWTLVEMELSLMYDILYTKAAVIHTWHGYSIRVLSPIAILISLLLFQFSGEDNQSEVDAATTYVLFGGALFMELISLLNTLGSSWMFATLSSTRCSWIRYKVLCSERWDYLRRVVVHLNYLATGESRSDARRWSGNMGQYNMLHFCSRPNTPLTAPLLGRLADLVGFGELWNRKHFSGTKNMSNHVLVKYCIDEQMELLHKGKELNTLGMIREKWGKAALHRCKENMRLDQDITILERTLGHEFQEGIIIWHIGTDCFLAWSQRAKDKGASSRVEAIKVLSNYMMFLLVERPDMLPGIAQNRLYQLTCEKIQELQVELTRSSQKKRIWAMLKSLFRVHDGPGSISRASYSENLAQSVYNEYYGKEFSQESLRLTYISGLAEDLLDKEEDGVDSLQLLLEVWTDMLIYAGVKCSRESHAKKLSSGGELTTIMWLMAEHIHQLSLEEEEGSKQASDEEELSTQEYHDNYRL